MVQTDFETGNWFKSFDRHTVMRNAACVLPWNVQCRFVQMLLLIVILGRPLSGPPTSVEALQAPRGVGSGEGFSPPQPTSGLGERRELSSGVQWGLHPGRKRFFSIF